MTTADYWSACTATDACSPPTAAAEAVVLSVWFMSAVLMLSSGLSSQSDSGVAAYRDVALVVHGQKILSNPPDEFITRSGAPGRDWGGWAVPGRRVAVIVG